VLVRFHFVVWVGVETHWSGLSPTSFTRSAMAVEKKLSSLGLVRGKEKGTLEHRKERGGAASLGVAGVRWHGRSGMGRQQSTSCDRVGEEREKREKEGERLNSYF
jgi:hypothetical protein